MLIDGYDVEEQRQRDLAKIQGGNTHNTPVQRFYKAMGGKEIARTPAHADKRDDQITYEFEV